MRIKISTLHAPPSGDLSAFTGSGDNVFDEVKFIVNEDVSSADAWVVIDDLPSKVEKTLIPKGALFYVSAENIYNYSHFLRPEKQHFLDQFDHVSACHPTVRWNATFAPPYLPWMINQRGLKAFSPHKRDLNFLQGLSKPEKSKALSVFCSTKIHVPEHEMRLQFVKKLKTYFGDDLDWFGAGVNPVEEKWDGLERYSVSIAMENRSTPGMFSEKILDPFLSWTTPAYWGAPDIQSFLPLRQEQLLDVRNLRESVDKIKKLIQDSEAGAFDEQLEIGRNLVLGNLHFLRRITSLVRQNKSAAESPIAAVTVFPDSYFRRRYLGDRIARKIGLIRNASLAQFP